MSEQMSSQTILEPAITTSVLTAPVVAPPSPPSTSPLTDSPTPAPDSPKAASLIIGPPSPPPQTLDLPAPTELVTMPITPAIISNIATGMPMAISVIEPELASSVDTSPPMAAPSPAPSSPASIVMVEPVPPIMEAIPLPSPVMEQVIEVIAQEAEPPAPKEPLPSPVAEAIMELVVQQPEPLTSEESLPSPVAGAILEAVVPQLENTEPKQVIIIPVAEPSGDDKPPANESLESAAIEPEPAVVPAQIVTIVKTVESPNADDLVSGQDMEVVAVVKEGDVVKADSPKTAESVVPVAVKKILDAVEKIKDAVPPQLPQIEIIAELKVDEPVKCDEPVNAPAVQVVEVPAALAEVSKAVEVIRSTAPASEMVVVAKTQVSPNGPAMVDQVVTVIAPKDDDENTPMVVMVERPCPASPAKSSTENPFVLVTSEDKSGGTGTAVNEHSAEPYVVAVRLRKRDSFRERFHRMVLCMSDPDYDRHDRHARARKRDRFRARFWSETLITFAFGGEHVPVTKAFVEKKANDPRGVSEHHTTHSFHAARKHLFSRGHERAQRRHAEKADLHTMFGRRAAADKFHDVETHHNSRAAFHARKEVEHAEKYLRGRKRYVEDELHAAERHLRERRHHHDRYLKAHMEHINAKMHHTDKAAEAKHVCDENKKRAGEYLVKAKQKLQQEKDQLEKYMRHEKHRSRKVLHTAEQRFDDVKHDVAKDIDTVERRVHYPSRKGPKQVEIRVESRSDVDGSSDLDNVYVFEPVHSSPFQFTNESLMYVGHSLRPSAPPSLRPGRSSERLYSNVRNRSSPNASMSHSSESVHRRRNRRTRRLKHFWKRMWAHVRWICEPSRPVTE